MLRNGEIQSQTERSLQDDGQDTVNDRRHAVLSELRKLADGTHPVTLLTGIENLDELGGTDD